MAECQHWGKKTWFMCASEAIICSVSGDKANGYSASIERTIFEIL